jgi:hypothetical protein
MNGQSVVRLRREAVLAGDVKERYVAVVVGAIAILLSSAAVAFAYTHITNGVGHGLYNQVWGADGYPVGYTNPPGSQWSTAEVRHYFADGSYNIQCSEALYGDASCQGNWGTAPCQKRYVGGAEGYLARHWVRLGSQCPGQIHP